MRANEYVVEDLIDWGAVASKDGEDSRDEPQSEPAEPEQGSITEGRVAA